MQQVRLQLECNVITTVFPQAISTLRFSGPDLFTHVIISVPQAFIGRAQHELIPALRGVCASPILVVPGNVLHGMEQQGSIGGYNFVSFPDVSYVRSIDELVNHLALIIPRIISENDVIWPKPGDIISSNQSRMHYTIGQRVAEGSYAVVHQCRDYFHQIFVMKIQKPHRCKTIVETDWNKERDFMSTVNHPNTIRLYDAFVYNNLYYYVMERADGTLRSLLDEHSNNRTTLPFDTFINFARQLLSGLCHIHKKKIIHRDLQVDNILYRRESGNIILKISDFGISKQANGNHEAQGTTGRGWEVAPELVTAGKTSYQSDIYQLGLIFYHMLTGWPAVVPSDGDINHVIHNAVPYRKARNLNTPIGNCISKMLQPDLHERYRNPYDVHQALLQALQHTRPQEYTQSDYN